MQNNGQIIETRTETRGKDGLALTWEPVPGAIRYALVIGLAHAPVPTLEALMKGATREFAFVGIPTRFSGAVDLGSPVGEERQYGLVAYKGDGTIAPVPSARFFPARQAPRDREYHPLTPPELVRTTPIAPPTAAITNVEPIVEPREPAAWNTLTPPTPDDWASPRPTEISEVAAPRPEVDPWAVLSPTLDLPTLPVASSPPVETAPPLVAGFDVAPSLPVAAPLADMASARTSDAPRRPADDPWAALDPAWTPAVEPETPLAVVPILPVSGEVLETTRQPGSLTAPASDPARQVSEKSDSPSISDLASVSSSLSGMTLDPTPITEPLALTAAASPPVVDRTVESTVTDGPTSTVSETTEDHPGEPESASSIVENRPIEPKPIAIPAPPAVAPTPMDRPVEQAPAVPSNQPTEVVPVIGPEPAPTVVVSPLPAVFLVQPVVTETPVVAETAKDRVDEATPLTLESSVVEVASSLTASTPPGNTETTSLLPPEPEPVRSTAEQWPSEAMPAEVARPLDVEIPPRLSVLDEAETSVAPTPLERDETASPLAASDDAHETSAPPPAVKEGAPPTSVVEDATVPANKEALPRLLAPPTPVVVDLLPAARSAPALTPASSPLAADYQTPSFHSAVDFESPATSVPMNAVEQAEQVAIAPTIQSPLGPPASPHDHSEATTATGPVLEEEPAFMALDPAVEEMIATLLDEADLYLLPQWLDLDAADRLLSEAAHLASGHPRVKEMQAALRDLRSTSGGADPQALLDEANRALSDQDYWRAVDLYEQILATASQNDEALRGLARTRLMARWSAQFTGANGDAPRLQHLGDAFMDEAPDLAARSYAAAFALRPTIATLRGSLLALAHAQNLSPEAFNRTVAQGVESLRQSGRVAADTSQDDALAVLHNLVQRTEALPLLDEIENAVEHLVRALVAGARHDATPG